MASRGRLAFNSPDEMAERIDEYFNSRQATRTIKGRDANGNLLEWEETYYRPPTMAGLALSLGITRQTLINYAERDEFLPVLTRAKHQVAEWVEEALFTREGSNGARFALEVNHGYGREAPGGTSEPPVTKIIPPAIGEQRKAIPKWEPEEDE